MLVRHQIERLPTKSGGDGMGIYADLFHCLYEKHRLQKMSYSLNIPTISSVILFLESISLISSSDRRLSVKETTQNRTIPFKSMLITN